VPHRVWDFSWRAEGFSLDYVAYRLREIIHRGTFPFAIVAHDRDRYLGSTLGIASDLDERPQLTPWIAAVWVELEYRLQNVGRLLVSHAESNRFEQAFNRIYLCARTERSQFCTRQGWIPVESNVGKTSFDCAYKRAG
jgi:GNAT superfamily N-acetyltransferase